MLTTLLLFVRGAKWTACEPEGGERHFVVRGAFRSEVLGSLRARRPDRVLLEAVTTGRVREVAAAELSDPQRWRPGWRRDADARAG